MYEKRFLSKLSQFIIEEKKWFFDDLLIILQRKIRKKQAQKINKNSKILTKTYTKRHKCREK